MEQPKINQTKRTIEAHIAEVSVEGEVALEQALVSVSIVGVNVPIKDRKVLNPNEARTLTTSLGVDNYYAIQGKSVMADYIGQELKRIYAR